MSSLRNRNLATSPWNLFPQLFIHASRSWKAPKSQSITADSSFEKWKWKHQLGFPCKARGSRPSYCTFLVNHSCHTMRNSVHWLAEEVLTDGWMSNVWRYSTFKCWLSPLPHSGHVRKVSHRFSNNVPTQPSDNAASLCQWRNRWLSRLSKGTMRPVQVYHAEAAP